MSLLQYVKNIIYKAKGFDNVRIPQAYDSFGILMPEASSSVQGIRPFPLPDDEHLFALLLCLYLEAVFDNLPFEVVFSKCDGCFSVWRSDVHN